MMRLGMSCGLPLLLAFTVTTLAAAAPPPAATELRREVSQYGVTWTFAEPAAVGKFLTGDWFVVGPVTVASVAPPPAAGRNGSVVNPPAGVTQGYDDRMHHYDAALRAAFPLRLAPGQSLVSTASVERVGDRTPDTVEGHYARGPLRTAVVLTCVASPPPADAFRPAYVGEWKEMFTAGQLRRDRLPALAPPGPVPDAARFERFTERIWLDHQREWVNREMHPLENMPDYGREITNIVSTVALLLLLENKDGRYDALLHNFVQLGIDYYGAVQSNNDLWRGNGGHNSGRKWPILFAGWVLDYPPMQKVEARFQEDDQTYFGRGYAGQRALWRIALGNPNAGHEEVPPEQWPTYGSGANNGVKAEGYRRLNGPTWVGQALAARLLGAEGMWRHEPFFEYVDRWVAEEGVPPGFVGGMWTAYRDRAAEIRREVRGASTEAP